MAINPLLTRQLLEQLEKSYPRHIGEVLYEGRDRNEVNEHLLYLHDHKLIDAKTRRRGSNGLTEVLLAAITTTGRDFLSADGGLTTRLGVITVRLHEDTIKDLLIKKIEASAEPQTVKKALTDQVKALPAETVKTLATKLLEAGLDHLPDAVRWIHRWLSGQ